MGGLRRNVEDAIIGILLTLLLVLAFGIVGEIEWRGEQARLGGVAHEACAE